LSSSTSFVALSSYQSTQTIAFAFELLFKNSLLITFKSTRKKGKLCAYKTYKRKQNQQREGAVDKSLLARVVCFFSWVMTFF